LPRDRLLALLREVRIAPDELIRSADTAWSTRLAAYWSARDRFIEVGRDIVPTRDAGRMLAQVREPLLGVLRISPDFRPAYDPLLRMANALNESDPAAARALLNDLARLHPAGQDSAQHAMQNF
jgi:spermidine synthase